MIVGPDEENTPDISVIIPLHRDGPRFRQCLEQCRRMHVGIPYEILCVSDHPVQDLPRDVRLVRTGSSSDTSPAVKRDMAEHEARGAVLAFIDDDAFPSWHWLDVAKSALDANDVAGVGGPGVTPPDSPWRERLGGAVYESPLGAGPLRFRFVPIGPERPADDLPAYNLVIRRAAIQAVGGWDSDFYGGEDTKLCLALVSAGYRLRYVPTMVVFHHRRPVFRSHLRQIANVGRHRGYFVKRYPGTSRRAVYLLPIAATLALVTAAGAWLALAMVSPAPAVAVGAATWLAVAATSIRSAGFAAVAFPAILVCHHVWYAASFVRGLMTRELVR